MKLCALQWIIALMFAGVSVAYDAEAQVLDQEISINLSGVPFEEALQQIQDLTNVKFFYSPGQLTGEGPVTLQVNGRALGEVLEGLLGPRGIEYRVHEREATITLRKSAATQPQLPDNSEAGSKKRRALVEVTGTVTDGSGEPMAGVNVVVKGTTIGTTTDSEGRYRIDASAEATLVFSFIGFSSFETRVGGRTVIDVVLQENITSLGEVVVNAGYYSTTRKLQTGSIVKIEAEEIAQQPVSDPLAALQGRVAGMEIVQ
ncbi:MAG TPA: carboxypeptidase-like regulatory domain-containing protein, partial [Cyclobacteriaceae bacterium]|nr:carboxypeptidase-like regulatory domain-containing protein [Cyclobacteriaceae bacterium]